MESRVERGFVQVAQPHLHAVLPEVWNADDHTDTHVSGSPLASLINGGSRPAWLRLRKPRWGVCVEPLQK